MIEWILKPALILMAAGLVHLLSGRAAVRHFAWTLAFTGLLLLPLLSPVASVSRSASPVLVPISVSVPVAMQEFDPGLTVGIPATTRAPQSRRLPYTAILCGGWLAGALSLASRLINSWRKVRRLTQEACAVGSFHAVPVLEHAEVQTPFTWGVFKPVILLPAGKSVAWSGDRRKHVLSHEYAHIRRADWASQMIAQATCVLYWFHPLVWVAARTMRRAGEQACDDAVVCDGHSPDGYAEHLLNLARQSQTPVANPSLVVPMWDRSQLEERIMKILEQHDRRSLGRFAAASMTVLAMTALAPLVLVRIQAQPAAASTGKITLQGVVNDPSGARVPGAKVIAKLAPKPGVEPGTPAVTVSGEDGSYKFEVPGGGAPIIVAVEKAGFMRTERTVTMAQEMAAGRDIVSRDFTLNLGQVNETIGVAGVRPQGAAVKTGPPTRIRVGGNVQAAKLLRRTNPEYPKELQAQGVEGTVELEAVISKEGNILNLHPKSKLVHEGLIQAASSAVSTWQYQPTLLNGLPVEIITTVTVRFYLQ